MSGRILYIETDGEPDNTPVTGCGCGWKGTLGKCDPVTGGALTAGDASPCGRCPKCDCFIYLDRPKDRAIDALESVLWGLAQGYPPGDSNLTRVADKLAKALSDAPGGLTVTITIS